MVHGHQKWDTVAGLFNNIKILSNNNNNNVKILRYSGFTKGKYYDHYDPLAKKTDEEEDSYFQQEYFLIYPKKVKISAK